MQLRARKGIPQDLLEGETGGPRLPGEGATKREGAAKGEGSAKGKGATKGEGTLKGEGVSQVESEKGLMKTAERLKAQWQGAGDTGRQGAGDTGWQGAGEKQQNGGVVSAMATHAKLSLFSAVGISIVLFQVTCEVGKQVSNYSIQYYNAGKYPLPQTVIVVVVEVIKLVVTLVRSGCRPPAFRSDVLKHSLKFLLPSVLYAINNNIYFAGLMLVPPPIWLILCSFRTVVTASMYKFVLKREITRLQFVGALFIVLSIMVAKSGDIFGSSKAPVIPPAAFLLAAVASFNSVGAAVYTESLFKKEGENFLDQQFWLYLYGILVAVVVHVISFTNGALTGLTGNLAQASTQVQVLLVAALLFGGIGGLVVAAILKRLDNIVKEYSGATANMFTAILCSVLFPEKFQFTIFILFAMMFLLTGIYLYETQKAKPKPLLSLNSDENKEPLLPPVPS